MFETFNPPPLFSVLYNIGEKLQRLEREAVISSEMSPNVFFSLASIETASPILRFYFHDSSLNF